MSCRRIPLFALSLAALPMTAVAQEADITGARIMACEAERTGESCATLLSQIFVCDNAPEMEGCEALLSLRTAAVDMAEREAEMNDTETGDDVGIVDEPEDDANDVEVRAEGELADELEEESLTEDEERLRDEDEEGEADDATGRPDDENGADDAENSANDESGAVDAAAPGNDAAALACPVLGSADWAAWVNAMPGPDGPGLIVTGTVTLPTPGYDVTLEQGPSDRSARPVQVVQLSAEAPGGMVSQVLSDYPVRFEMASPALLDGMTAPFTAVRVVCGDEELARIEPVEVAQ